MLIAEAAKKSQMKLKLLRSMEWLKNQEAESLEKLALPSKNDFNLIFKRRLESNPKDYLLETSEVSTIPAGVGESEVKPKDVPIHRLRLDRLHLECEWQSCGWTFSNHEMFQMHVRDHVSNVHVINNGDADNVQYVCLWDVCGHKTYDYEQVKRHIHYHAYHARLMAIGYNGRATLKLARCKKDSSKRNQLPPLLTEHWCMWIGCDEKINDIQMFFEHIKAHVEPHGTLKPSFLCSWAGCGMRFPRRVMLTMHLRSHTGERLIACYHCGQHFASNRKLRDHLSRQNVDPNSPNKCSVCGVAFATEYLLREHARQHVSSYACALCDMSAPSLAALAQHARYRHLAREDTRLHPCPHCEYSAITKSDLRKHITRRHNKKRKKDDLDRSDKDISDDENLHIVVKKKANAAKKYACHMCPAESMKVFSRGSRLTRHLVSIHGAQWPFGHSRFRYQISEDGMYRLTTTRYELLEVSKKIVDGYSGRKNTISNEFEFNLVQKSEPTETTPRHFEITLKGAKDEDKTPKDPIIEPINSEVEAKIEPNTEVEITMYDVDEDGNILNLEVSNVRCGL